MKAVPADSLLEIEPTLPPGAVHRPAGDPEGRLPLDIFAIALVLAGAMGVAILGAGWREMSNVLLIVGGTCISEDITSLTVGNLVREGRVTAGVGLAACFLGIVLSDTGIWAIGKYAGRPLLARRWLAPLFELA